jgi:hypothetical protein
LHQRGVLDERVDAEHDKPLLVGALPNNDDVVNAHGFVWVRCKHYPGGHGLVVPSAMSVVARRQFSGGRIKDAST